MLPDNNRLNYLFLRYLQDHASGEELEELFAYIRQSDQQAMLKEQITKVFQEMETQEEFKHVNWDAIFSKIINEEAPEVKESKTKISKLRFWISIAATVLVLILGGGGAYLYFRPKLLPTAIIEPQMAENDILPGGNKATLTLSNGAVILLDSASIGKLAYQGNMSVVKTNSGQLAYRSVDTKDKTKESIVYNTLTTPRGGEYRLILSDGTKVWLNAASSIHYPAAFTGTERKVKITGEAYFEVVHDDRKTFKVQVGERLVEDLGTHFNINAYADEPTMKTTLLEGSVKLGNTVLHPGEQAVVNKNGKIRVVKDVAVENAVAWRKGLFAFKNDNLQTVMRQLSRWYDVDITYQPGADNKQEFSGSIDRSLTLSEVLNGLEQVKAHFKIEANRKVVILP